MTGIETEIVALGNLSTKELRKQWRRHYHGEPPAGLSRDLLVRAIAYKIQERLLGGLPQSVKRKLRTLAGQLESVGRSKFKPDLMLKPGTKLVREWGGRTHTVIVREDGFGYGEKSYRSLSMIAREITGARWSGPRFFGTIQPTKPTSPVATKAYREQA